MAESFHLNVYIIGFRPLTDIFQGWFPMSRKFSVTHVNFTRVVNEIEAMYERPRVNVKLERGSTLTFMRDLSNIVSVLYTRVNLRAYARKNYTTVVINLKTDTQCCWC